MTAQLDKKKLVESMNNMEKVISVHEPLEKAGKIADGVMKGLDAVGGLLSAVPVWGSTAKAICSGVSKLIKLALGATANQEMCHYLSNRILLLHTSSMKIFATKDKRTTKGEDDEDVALAIEKILVEMKKLIEQCQKLIEPYTPRLDEQDPTKVGNAKKFAQFLAKVYHNVCDSMDREKFEELNKKIDRISQDTTLLFVVSSQEAKVPTISPDQIKNLWKQSEKEITDKVKKAVAEGNDEIKQVLGSISSQIDALSDKVTNMQDMMCSAFATLLKNKDFEACKWKGEVSRLVIDKSTILGRGGGGVVYAAQLGGSEKLAAKRLFATEGEDPQISARAILRECRRLQDAKHPNVVNTYGLIVQKPDTFLIQERCVCSLDQFVQSLGKELLPQPVRLFYCWSLAKVYSHLHQLGLVMGDIKQSNVLLNSVGKCCVCDFGGVKSLSTLTAVSPGGEATAESDLGVTPAYAAPEISQTLTTTYQSDVYAFGALIYETLTGKQFYKSHTAITLDQTIPDIKIRRLLSRCLSSSPLDRPTMSSVDHELENLVQTATASTDGGVEDDTLFSIIQIFKKKAASSEHFDPNSTPNSPTSPHSPKTSSFFPYWMSALPISDENKRVLLDNEFDTLDTLSSLKSETDFEAFKLDEIPVGARKKILASLPEVCAGAHTFETVNPEYEKQLIAFQREEQQAFKAMLTMFESTLATELLSKSHQTAYDQLVQEFEEESLALSAHVSRVSKLTPVLSKRHADLATINGQLKEAESKLEEIKDEFNTATEKAIATKLSPEDIQARLSPEFKKELTTNIVKAAPTVLDGVTDLSEAKKKLQTKLDEYNNTILPDLSKKLSDVEGNFAKAKADKKENKIGKYKLTEADGWQRDEDAPTCNKCKGEFSLFNRRHHCRAECGLVFCGNCSSNTVNHNGQQIRCCDECFNRVNATEKLASHLPQLESSFKDAQRKLNEAKKTLQFLERAFATIEKLADQLREKEDQLLFADMAAKNKETFQKYFEAEEKVNALVNQELSLQIEIQALNVLLDPLQKIPEKMPLTCSKFVLGMNDLRRSHVVALVNATAEDRKDNEFLQFNSEEEIFDSSANLELTYTWTSVLLSRKKNKTQDVLPPVHGISPAHLAALVGFKQFFTEVVPSLNKSKSKEDALFMRTADQRTPASFAGMLGQVELLQYFLDNGLPITSRSDSGLSPVHWCTTSGCLAGLKLMIEAGFDKDAVTEKSGLSPLHLAAYINRAGCADYLLSAGCEALRAKIGGGSPLHACCSSNSRETAKVILASGKADKNESQNDGLTPLVFCAQSGHLELVKLLVSVGADVEKRSSKGFTAFHAAAHFGQKNVAEWMLRNVNGLNVSPASAEYGLTPLHSCAKEGHLDIIKLLIEVGKVDKDERDKAGRNPIGRACISKQPEVIKYLLSVGSDPELKYTDGTELRPIHSAANSGDLETLKTLVDNAPKFGKKKQINIDPRTKTRSTPLFLVSRLTAENQDASLDMARYLISKGADVDCVNTHQYSMLHNCAEFGNLPLFRYLVEEKKLNIECASSAGSTILTVAAANGHDQILEYVLENHTINREASTKIGNTALISAALNRSPACARKLIEYSADVNAKNNNGWNAFMAAAASVDFETVKSLCAANCDQRLKTKLGNTALHLVAQSDKEELFEEAADIVNFLLFDDEKIADTAFFKKDGMGLGENVRNALSLACEKGNVPVIKILLQVKGCDVENTSKLTKSTPLNYICRFPSSNAVDGARLLISHKANKNTTTEDGRTPLINAAVCSFPVLKLLISSGANKSCKTNNGWSALHFACSSNQADSVKYMLQSVTGFDVNEKTKVGTSPIGLAILENAYEVVEYLLDAHQDEYIKIDFDAIDSEGRDLIHLACWPKGSKATVKLVDLLFTHEATSKAKWRNCDSAVANSELKSLPIHCVAEGAHGEAKRELFTYICEKTPKGMHDVPDALGKTPAYCALVGGSHLTMIKLHENYNADLNAISAHTGNSMLTVAAQLPMFSMSACKYLIDNGANPEYVNPKNGRTALHYAIMISKSTKCIEYLLKQPGLSISACDGAGASCLFRAVETGNKDLVEFMLKQPGIDLNTPTNTDLLTPLHVAAAKNFTDISKLLVSAGCNRGAVSKAGKTPYDVAVGAKFTETSVVIKP